MLLYTCSDLYPLQFCSNCVYPFWQAWPPPNLSKPIECSVMYFKSKLYYDLRSVGQSVLVSGTHLGPMTSFQLLLGLASAVFLVPESRTSYAHILLSQISDSPDLEEKVPLFIYLGHWVEFSWVYITAEGQSTSSSWYRAPLWSPWPDFFL
jgi:hypothetical protein